MIKSLKDMSYEHRVKFFGLDILEGMRKKRRLYNKFQID